MSEQSVDQSKWEHDIQPEEVETLTENGTLTKFTLTEEQWRRYMPSEEPYNREFTLFGIESDIVIDPSKRDPNEPTEPGTTQFRHVFTPDGKRFGGFMGGIPVPTEKEE